MEGWMKEKYGEHNIHVRITYSKRGLYGGRYTHALHTHTTHTDITHPHIRIEGMRPTRQQYTGAV